MDLSEVLDIVRLTDTGLVRRHNEDAIASDASIGFVILADGMGGYNAGEVASEMAVLTITAELKEALGAGSSQYILPDVDRPVLNKEILKKLMIDAVAYTNASIYHASQTYSQCAGMGTTLVLGLFINNQLLAGHIGDSRIYRLRNQHLVQMTEDHSLLQEQIRAGIITPEQAKHSSHKNLVTRALGVDPKVEMELNEFDVEMADVYLFCSDGLTDLVDDGLIQSTLNSHVLDLTKAADALVKLANEHGGNDNISVILAKVNNSYEDKNTWYDNFVGWLK
ncbi:Stp1/IreP family PP2C-type Ser/Thr phosphatase [Methylotenera sp.]|jgi:protein phosphatase|uniref:Stp1/IreP family PP2C-type Ser/Thr phosphatase n=1 Tax=Methylotenera sp. TaxID=2051956 RepID=UPI002733F152|nr:Stp1/IreP family PP2C-type Ser/Thr phosphatase [Methylotenera sp.]MDP3212425.1 Stp1/IreP family PP2C-type Ser/Thr phosphatase [Methylotenera sp.]